jgi:2-polyprenyl-3-methyl-5-hydroxy-6-metoxy-1,4-benzoquinol methylase
MKALSAPDLSRLHALAALTRASGQALREQAPRFQAIKDRRAAPPRVVVAHQLFQTPPTLAARLVSLLGDITGLSVLEPSAGLGRLVDECHRAGAGDVVAVDIAPACVASLQASRPWLDVKMADFLTLSPSDLGLFDAVAINPPFTMRSDIRHTLHALQFLKPGGVLAGICMSGSHRERDLRPQCSSWELIPAGTFRESGTEVETALFTIHK